MSADNNRVSAAAAILRAPHQYIICEGCGSIFKKTLLLNKAVCQICDGYAFNDDPDRITEQAKKLALEKERSIQRDDML